MDYVVIVALICGALGVAYSLITAGWVFKQDAGNARMQEISSYVAEGAMAYLTRQYKVVAMIAVILVIILLLTLGLIPAIGFIIGLVGSGLAGFIGMKVSVNANVRVAAAAGKSLPDAMDVAFKGGSVTGIVVTGLALLGVAGFFLIAKSYNPDPKAIFSALVALGFGSSLMSVFARVGGGIYTKAADVGADLVGKVEADLPEDDPRNAGVIADNVGDNVGDCAGMAADLYETYTVTIVAAMLLGKTIYSMSSPAFFMPLLIGGAAIIASIIGTFFVKLSRTTPEKDLYIMGSLYKGLAVAGVLAAIFFGFVAVYLPLGAPGHVPAGETACFQHLSYGSSGSSADRPHSSYHRVFHRHVRSGKVCCASQYNRTWNEHHCGTCYQHDLYRAPCDCVGYLHIDCLRTGRRLLGKRIHGSIWHCRDSGLDVVHDRYGSSDRLLRSDYG
jgi:K(+)-stimulated pyrophosphate-energized sodium pump